MRKNLILAATALVIASSNVQAQVPLSAYVDANGFINVQALMCAQLAGPIKKMPTCSAHGTAVGTTALQRSISSISTRAKQDEHEVIMTCKANPGIRIIDAIARVLKDERARLGITLKYGACRLWRTKANSLPTLDWCACTVERLKR